MIDFKKSLFLKKDLEKLEDSLKKYVFDFEGIIKDILSNTLLAGGKRLRPALFLICARNENYDIDYLLSAAKAIEILHTASLIHDDIIDNSMLRRGRKTIHSIYDKDTAKYAGDYLFTYSFCLLNSYKNQEIIKEMAKTSQQLVIGEFDQLKTRNLLNQSEDLYIKKINEKTSSLFKLACKLGAVLSNSRPKDIERMEKFGGYLGIAFQINDDLIDIDIKKPKSGLDKPAGNDIKQGNITLPFIYALKNRRFKKKISDILKEKSFNDENAMQIIDAVSETDAVDKAKRRIYFYLNLAKKTISQVEGSQRAEGLREVCDLILKSTGKTHK